MTYDLKFEGLNPVSSESAVTHFIIQQNLTWVKFAWNDDDSDLQLWKFATFNQKKQGTLTEGECSVQLTSSLR